MKDMKQNFRDSLALALCLTGVVIAVALLDNFFGLYSGMIAYALFAAFQIAAIVLGIVTRMTPQGKTAAITSGLLLIGSLAFLG